MARLNLKLETDLNGMGSILTIECSSDIAESIISSTKEMFEIEMLTVKNMISNTEFTRFSILITDREIIKKVENWIKEKAILSIAKF